MNAQHISPPSLLLTTLLLILPADAAHAPSRGAAAPAGSLDGGAPKYNIETICRDAAAMAHLLETSAPDNAQNCIDDERHAHEQLLEQWSQFDAADRLMCNGAARSGAVAPAYTELMTCLEMARDNHRREAGTHVARQPDQSLPPRAMGAATVERLGLDRNAVAARR
jgi:hypothetical protein